MAHVFLGFAEALPAPEVYYSLKAAGHRVAAFARSDRIAFRSLIKDDLHVIPAPETSTAATIHALEKLITDLAPDVFLPLDDTGLWLAQHVRRPAPVALASVAGDQADFALDKARQVELAQKAGLAVPATIVASSPDAFDELAHFPAIAKPARAMAEAQGQLVKPGASYLLDTAEAKRFAESASFEAGPYLLQPLIPGTGEGVFGTVSGGVVHNWSGHRRVRMMNPHGSGSSACKAIAPERDLKDRVAKFLDLAGWQGPFMMEFLRDANGTPWFMELNGRMWGSMSLARRQGLEYPAWAVAAALDPEFNPPAITLKAPESVGLQRNLGYELLHLAFVLRGPKSEFHRADWPSIWKSAAGVFKPAALRHFYNYSPDHPTYPFRDAWWAVSRKLRR